MKKKFVITATALFLLSCESRTYEDISVAVPNPTYNANIKPIIANNCLECHQSKQTPHLNTYQEVRNQAETGALLCKIQGLCGIMPPTGKMPQVNVNMIKLWAEQGYIQE